MSELDDLVRRVAALEGHLARVTAPARAGIQVSDMSHHPRPGTWLGDSSEAECRFCGQRITQDPPDSRTPGLWRYLREPHCHARAAGAAARD